MYCSVLCKALLTVPSPGSHQMSCDKFLYVILLTVRGGITLALHGEDTGAQELWLQSESEQPQRPVHHLGSPLYTESSKQGCRPSLSHSESLYPIPWPSN